MLGIRLPKSSVSDMLIYHAFRCKSFSLLNELVMDLGALTLLLHYGTLLPCRGASCGLLSLPAKMGLSSPPCPSQIAMTTIERR
jgi:hypothetical protein